MKKNLGRAILMLSKYFVIGFLVQLVAFNTLPGKNVEAQLTNPVHANLNNVSIEQVFNILKKSANISFIYDERTLNDKQKVNISGDHLDVGDVLDELASRFDLDYVKIGNTITIKKKNSPSTKTYDLPYLFTWETAPFTIDYIAPIGKIIQFQISGTVQDSLGNPLIGVTVQIKGTTEGTTTDARGHYQIDASKNATLVFSYVGYQDKEIPVNGQETINVTLYASATGLNEIVVVGYGTQKKVNLTGSVESISGEVFENRPITNIAQGLEGQMANLNINIADGGPNTTPTLNIRGGTSFSGGTFKTGSPLILVDGVEMDISQLNPNDIANISVLKDAASAAIYGARAAYGVVLITTKSGRKSQKPQFKYVGSIQWNKPTAVPDLLDAYTIQAAAINAYKLENRTPPTNMTEKLNHIKAYMDNPDEAPVYYMTPGGSIEWVGNSDEYALALRKATPMQKHNLSLSGGGEKTTYYASLGYLNQEGFYRLNTDKYERYNAMLNLTTDVTKWFSINFKSIYSYSRYSEPVSPAGKGGWWIAMAHEPGRNINMPIKTPSTSPVGVMYTDNILSFMDYGSSNTESKENNMLYIAPVITPLKGWQIKGDFSYKSYNYRRKRVIPLLKRIVNDWENPTTVYTDPTSVQKWSTSSKQFTLDAYTDYTFSVNKHNFYALVGFHQQWYKEVYLGGRGEDMLSPNIPVIGQTLGNEYAYDAESHWALRGAFYRVTYNYNHKYLLESDGRYQGSSRFPHDTRFKFFQSFSGAWRISEEPFWQSLKPFVNNFKLRASYGSLGNQDVPNYIYIPSYGTISEVEYLFGGDRPVGVTPPGLVSPTITWETATTLDFGVNLELFKKFDLSFDWYNRTTTDILVQGDKLPAVLGTSPPTKNSGTLKTLGWDLTTSWRDHFQNGLNLNVRFVLSNYNSEITQFNGNPDKLLTALYTGKKMGEIWGFETVGTYQTEEQVEKSPSQKQLYDGKWYPGDIQYRDLDGDGIIGYGANTVADPGDRKIIGNSIPHLKFGFNVNASWKNFDLNVFLEGVGKRDYWIGSNLYWGAINGGTGTWYVYNHSWTPDRKDAFFPAYKPRSVNILPQTKYLINAAYLRLNNLTVAYNIPDYIIQGKLHINSAKVFFAGYNLFRITETPDIFDPEMMSADYPMFRSLAVGLQVAF